MGITYVLIVGQRGLPGITPAGHPGAPGSPGQPGQYTIIYH